MKKIWNCRRSMLALIGMGLLMAMAIVNKVDTSGAIATIVLAVSASNAYQGSKEKKD